MLWGDFESTKNFIGLICCLRKGGGNGGVKGCHPLSCAEWKGNYVCGNVSNQEIRFVLIRASRFHIGNSLFRLVRRRVSLERICVIYAGHVHCTCLCVCA